MKSSTRRFVTIAAISLGLAMPLKMAFPDSETLDELSAEWWQWAISIPTPQNPLLDATGADCMVGQRGSVWFLAGTFFGGPATRTCSVPADKPLFFPVINSVQINTADVCGQSGSLSVKELRALAAPFIDAATNLSVELDGKAIDFQRLQSQVFEAAFPEDNIFNAPCGGPGTVPAAIYSPAVDDGFYVMLHPLKTGSHALHFHAESSGLVFDVAYQLTAVPVLRK